MRRQHALGPPTRSSNADADWNGSPLLLYDDLLRALACAELGIRDNDYAAKRLGLASAQGFVMEVGRMIEGAAPGEHARRLTRRYSQLVDRLALADADNDPSRIEEAVGIVRELRAEAEETVVGR